MTAEAAVDKAFKRVEAIFSKYRSGSTPISTVGQALAS